MTPKEKAIDLFRDMEFEIPYIQDPTEPQADYIAKKCALIAVDEILESQPSRRYWDTYDDETPSAITFWQEVKQEIENL